MPHTRAPWANSNRRTHLPSDWSSLSKRILQRDVTCRIAYPGTWWHAGTEVHCTGQATETDHAGDRDDHRPEVLRGACHSCHIRRTLEQSIQARREQAQLLQIPAEQHPGIRDIDGDI